MNEIQGSQVRACLSVLSLAMAINSSILKILSILLIHSWIEGTVSDFQCVGIQHLAALIK